MSWLASLVPERSLGKPLLKQQHYFRHLNTLWLVLVALVLLLLLFNPDWISRESIAGLLENLGGFALAVYVLLSLSRALFLLPCTPFVLAGAITFPDLSVVVLLISLAGVVAGALLVYSFPAFGNYDEYLEGKYPDQIAALKDRMRSDYIFWFIAGWSFFPLVPTDVICYVSGVARLPFRKLIVPLMVGEIPLVIAYVYLGTEIGEWLRL